jgi:hypothetical protein
MNDQHLNTSEKFPLFKSSDRKLLSLVGKHKKPHFETLAVLIQGLKFKNESREDESKCEWRERERELTFSKISANKSIY